MEPGRTIPAGAYDPAHLAGRNPLPHLCSDNHLTGRFRTFHVSVALRCTAICRRCLHAQALLAARDLLAEQLRRRDTELEAARDCLALQLARHRHLETVSG